MKRQQVIDILRAIKATPQRDRQFKYTLGLNTIAVEADLSNRTLHNIIATGRMAWESKQRLETALKRLARMMGDEAPLALRLAVQAKERPETAPERPTMKAQGVRFR